MLELGTFGSVRGVPGNGYPYRNPRPEADIGSAELNAAKRPLDKLRNANFASTTVSLLDIG